MRRNRRSASSATRRRRARLGRCRHAVCNHHPNGDPLVFPLPTETGSPPIMRSARHRGSDRRRRFDASDAFSFSSERHAAILRPAPCVGRALRGSSRDSRICFNRVVALSMHRRPDGVVACERDGERLRRSSKFFSSGVNSWDRLPTPRFQTPRRRSTAAVLRTPDMGCAGSGVVNRSTE